MAKASPVPLREWERFEAWIASGMHAGMGYMERWPEIRRDPRRLLDGARAVVSVAFNYRQYNPYPAVAAYALGEDYHKVLRRRLKTVAGALREEFGGEYRVCVDSAPILERYWATRCGVGVRSPLSGNIVVPGVGSMVFLAEIITTLALPEYRCGHSLDPKVPEDTDLCDGDTLQAVDPRDYDVCPTGALQPGGVVDARRCINYLTIERQGEWSARERALMSLPGAEGRVFGCDICQLACRSNSGAACGVLPEFRPLDCLPDLIEAMQSGNTDGVDFSKSPLSRGVRRKGAAEKDKD